LATAVVRNTVQNSSDNLSSYPPDNHHIAQMLSIGGEEIYTASYTTRSEALKTKRHS